MHRHVLTAIKLRSKIIPETSQPHPISQDQKDGTEWVNILKQVTGMRGDGGFKL
jgi:hypothetical protein